MPTENQFKMLRFLLELGCNKEIVVALLEGEGLSKSHLRYLAGPVLVHDPGWSDTMPDWIIPAIYADRLEQIALEVQQGIPEDTSSVSEVEVLGYMYSQTLTAPLTHEWTNIYLWCGQQSMSKHQRLQPKQSFANMIGNDAPLEISDYERKQFLLPLQRWLRKSVIKAAADRGIAKDNSSKSIKPRIQQAKMSLFELDA